MNPRILASFRSADLERWEEELNAVSSAGIDGLHLDVMDGRFVEERCFDASFVAKLRAKTSLLLDVHLIVQEPEKMVRPYVDAGADRVSFHWEATVDTTACIELIRRSGAKPGLVILPGTSVDAIRETLSEIDFVNPLGVDPTRGLGYQESTPERIRQLCEWRTELNPDLVVQADGGVWAKTRDALVEAGADELVGGYPIFSSDGYGAAIAALRDPTA